MIHVEWFFSGWQVKVYCWLLICSVNVNKLFLFQAFLNAVVRKAALKLASRQSIQDSSRLYMLPAAISEPLCTAEQQEWWDSVYKVTTNTARFDKALESR